MNTRSVFLSSLILDLFWQISDQYTGCFRKERNPAAFKFLQKMTEFESI